MAYVHTKPIVKSNVLFGCSFTISTLMRCHLPIMIVPIDPTKYPELWKAFGIARIPVPRDPFSKWKRVSEFLQGIWGKCIHFRCTLTQNNIRDWFRKTSILVRIKLFVFLRFTRTHFDVLLPILRAHVHKNTFFGWKQHKCNCKKMGNWAKKMNGVNGLANQQLLIEFSKYWDLLRWIE